jgi:hypothetical protein
LEDKIVKKLPFLIVLLGAIGSLPGITDGSVVSLDFHLGSDWPATETYTWDFDYDLQQLTVNETILELRPDSYWVFSISGRVDSDSTFRVVRNITNETGITWTAYHIYGGPAPAAGVSAGIVDDSIQFTKFETISFHGDNPWYRFSGQPFVLNGESFTMSFDMHTRYDDLRDGSFSVTLSPRPVPEPTTALLVALGAFVFHKRQASRG